MRNFWLILILCIPGALLSQTLTVQLETLDAASLTGDNVSVNATASGSDLQSVLYRYRIRTPEDQAFQLIRDFSPTTWIGWFLKQGEGVYEFEVTARNRWTGESATATIAYEIGSRLTDDTPVITPTRNELVYLYNSPSCPAGSTRNIRFRSSEGIATSVPPVQCNGVRTQSTYLAGLRPSSTYTVESSVADSAGVETKTSPPLELRTPQLSFTPAPVRVTEGALGEGVLFQNRVFQRSIAVDSSGAVVWYYGELTPYLVRPEAGGYFFALMESPGNPHEAQLLRYVDLAGNVITETNAAWINHQLAALDMQPITSFHHDVRRLPDGRLLVIAGTERIVEDVQGPGGVTVIGDQILLLDKNLQVQWAWDAFDHLDVTRAALMGETCSNFGGAGCPSYYIPGDANDWVHGNTIALTEDGNILYSARHQDWIVKIDFAGGTGSGRVLWRLGKDGDFNVISDDADPWFSHQHDPHYVEVDGRLLLLVFDNSNQRYFNDSDAKSRGQLYEIDENERTARLVLNADLGSYSFALGSAQMLPNGNFYFESGITPDQSAEGIEVDPAGNIVTRVQASTSVYRSIRMPSMYVAAP